MPARVLFFAFDACDVDAARQLAADGRMPTLQSLLDDHTTLAIGTVAPPGGVYVSAIWPTIFTAVAPEHHGYTCWERVDPATGALEATSPAEIAAEPFWLPLSRAGRRVALLDIPHTAPHPEVNGIMVCEWAAHDRHFGLQSWPPSLADELVAQHGLHPVAGLDHDQVRQFAPCDWTEGGPYDPRTVEQESALLTGMLRGLSAKRAASLDRLRSEDWDLFAVAFGETHCSGHQFWHLHEVTHELFDPGHAEVLGDPMGDVYAAVDDALAAHLAAIDADTDVIVLLSHGMGAHYTGTHLLDGILTRLDEHEEIGPRGRVTARAAKQLWGAVPVSARRVAHPAVARAVRTATRGRAGIGANPPDRLRQRFAAAPNNDPVGAVRVNLAGRDEPGVVPVERYDAVVDQLAEDLLDIVNLESGRPLVRAIERGTDLYPPSTPWLADLYVQWDHTAQCNDVYSPKIGRLRIPYHHVRTGDHKPHGLLLARGPSFVDQAPFTRMPVTGIAPTIAALLDTELPDVDGRVPDGLLRAPSSA